MAQSGFTPILIYGSTTTGNTPSASNLTTTSLGVELAINATDGKLFYKDNSGNVQVLATKATGTIGGSNTQVQYNSSGSLAGSANMTFNGSTLTLANDASISGLTVGKGGGSIAANTALGSGALAATNTSGEQTAIGNNALANNTSSASNTAVGSNALYTNTTGQSNVGLGKNALYYNTTGSFNIALGQSSLQSNTTASNNTAVGYQAGYSFSTNGGNIALGYQAAYSATGSNMLALGYQAGYSSTTTSTNAFIGYQSGYSNTTGASNNAFGSYRALYSNTTGSNNTAIGDQALQSNTTASNNTAVGYQAGNAITTGAGNVMLGYSAGTSAITNTGCVIIGPVANVSSSSTVNEIVIGYNSGAGLVGKGSNTAFIGNGAAYQGNNSATWSVTSDQRLKKNIVDNTVGLDAINKIQVRNFEYRLPEEVSELPQTSAIDIKGVQLGAIAQELAQVLPDCVKTESTGVMSVDTTNITWHLINAVKELSAKVTALEAQLGAK